MEYFVFSLFILILLVPLPQIDDEARCTLLIPIVSSRLEYNLGDKHVPRMGQTDGQ